MVSKIGENDYKFALDYLYEHPYCNGCSVDMSNELNAEECSKCTHRRAWEVIEESLQKHINIISILDETDFNNSISLNEFGEDKGYKEAICAISLEVDGKDRWV